MALIIYGIPNCDTMKKARTWLEDHNIQHEFHDYKTSGITKDRLELWLDQVPNKKLFNRASATYRGLTDEEKKSIDDNDFAISLAIKSPSLIKRPVLELDDKVLQVGFKPDQYEEKLG